jgi:hypothetical protein
MRSGRLAQQLIFYREGRGVTRVPTATKLEPFSLVLYPAWSYSYFCGGRAVVEAALRRLPVSRAICAERDTLKAYRDWLGSAAALSDFKAPDPHQLESLIPPLRTADERATLPIPPLEMRRRKAKSPCSGAARLEIAGHAVRQNLAPRRGLRQSAKVCKMVNSAVALFRTRRRRPAGGVQRIPFFCSIIR